MRALGTATRITGSALAVAGLAVGTSLASAAVAGRQGPPAPGSLTAAAALPKDRAIAARDAADAKGKVDGSVGVSKRAVGMNKGKATLGKGSSPVANRVDPKAMTSVASQAGACVPGYGRGGECLPNAPGSMLEHDGMRVVNTAWTCAWVRIRLPNGIAVVTTPASIALGKRMVTPPAAAGVDPIGLDRNHDGVACDDTER